MKTFMKFGAVVAVALACGAASADYLYAMVDDAFFYYDNSQHPTFDYLTVKVDGEERSFYGYDKETGTKVSLGDDSGTRMPSDESNSSSSFGAPDAGFYIDIGNGSHEYQTFLFEMFNDNNSTERVAWQEFMYKDVADHVFKEAGDTASLDPLVVSRVVPEPTSALLSLFGLAALALRRRKMA